MYHFSTVMTSHPRSALVLLDTETPGTSREIYSEDANDGTRTRNPSFINRQQTHLTKITNTIGLAKDRAVPVSN